MTDAPKLTAREMRRLEEIGAQPYGSKAMIKVGTTQRLVDMGLAQPSMVVGGTLWVTITPAGRAILKGAQRHD